MIRLVRDLPLGLVGGPLSPGEIRSPKAAKENWTSGGREGIRTLDLGVANAALSQLSYSPVDGAFYHFKAVRVKPACLDRCATNLWAIS